MDNIAKMMECDCRVAGDLARIEAHNGNRITVTSIDRDAILNAIVVQLLIQSTHNESYHLEPV